MTRWADQCEASLLDYLSKKVAHVLEGDIFLTLEGSRPRVALRRARCHRNRESYR